MSAPVLAPAWSPTHAAIKSKRIVSIDLLRGIVMILMVLDHVRDYFHGYSFQYDTMDLTHTSAPIFFTRWITHYCAPVFMLLAGVSASLYGEKKGRQALAFFLFTRGLWLVFLELFVVNLEWTFNPLYHLFILQVIWAFGFCMMALAGLIYINRRLLLLIGLLLVGAHNLLDGIHVPGQGVIASVWAFLHDSGFVSYGAHANFFVVYPTLPWVGIITLGYCCGALYNTNYEASRRRKILLALGVGALLLFVLLRLGKVYGEPIPWSSGQNGVYTLLSFLRVTKYPPSLDYALVTLGPALIFLAWAERPLNRFTEWISIFGRVPMFFYLLHIFVVHLAAVFAAALSGYSWKDMVMLKSWVTANPSLRGYGFNLIMVYLIWIAIILLLYPLCKWYDGYKRSHVADQPFLSYL